MFPATNDNVKMSFSSSPSSLLHIGNLGLLGDETLLDSVFWVPVGLRLFLGSYRKGLTGQRPTAMD